MPSEEQPFIKGLLDPCTNSKIAPNIPAEKLYDKQARPLAMGDLCGELNSILACSGPVSFGAHTLAEQLQQ